MSKRLGGIIGCKYKTSSWHLNGFPYYHDSNILGQQYNIGEKPTVILYTPTTLIAMQGHQKNSEIKNIVVHHQI